MSETFEHDGVTFRVGDDVEIDVEWRNGRRSTVRGKLITICGDEAFVDSSIGAVAGKLETLTGVQQ